MTFRRILRCGITRGRSACRLLVLLLLVGTSSAALAENCSEYPGGVLDGATGTPAPSQLQIDRNCTIRNYPAGNPLGTNFSFLTQPGQTAERWLVVFDNVVHTGQMACNSVAEHKIWFTNGSSTSIQEGCQNLLIPVEKIDKQNPAGQTTAAIGVPFTYTLTMPVLFDPGTSTVINVAGSVNDLHGVTLIDDLNATGVDLTYVSHVAYWRDSGTPVTHTFSNAGGVLTFDDFPIVPAGEQIMLELTVVLDDSPANVIGTQFVNTAKWDFGRLIDGVFYEPLPGEWGISDPMTIGGPDLILMKFGPATLNLGQTGDFALSVWNSGSSDAWDVMLVDRLPETANGGMCDATPTITSAQVFASDGVTSVPGKGPLIEGTDYLLDYGGASGCELTLVLRTAASVIGASERLLIRYQAALDTDTEDAATLANVAAATQWFNGDISNADRQSYSRSLTDGSVGTFDHEDAHTVTAVLTGFFFEKTVANLTSGVSPAITAAPGDRLRYTLQLRTTDSALNDVGIYDDLGDLNASAVFAPGSLTLVSGSIPPGADTSNTNPNGGGDAEGIIDIRDLSVAAGSEIQIQFDVTLRSVLLDGTIVSNQADLIDGVKIADSDDPNVNGLADPDVAGDEDPTRIQIEVVPPEALLKANTQATATIGEPFSYRITVPSVPHSAPLFDVKITDDLVASAADLRFVDVTKISGAGAWTPQNSGLPTDLVIDDPSIGIDIPAGEQIVIDVTVMLLDTASNVAGLSFTNTAAFSYNQLDNDDLTVRPGDSGTTATMTIVEPDVTLEKSGPAQMRIGEPASFTLNVHNVGTSPAYGLSISDVLPDTADGGLCDAGPQQIVAQRFAADGVTAVAPPLVQGVDYDATFAASPTCTLTLQMLTPAAAVGADERLIVSYDATLDLDTVRDAILTNIAGATRWFSIEVADPASPGDARTYARALTDGTPGALDHEDEHTFVEFTPLLTFEKTVINVTSGDDPATVATPGDTLRYTLRLENLSDAAVNNLRIVDELDRLNASAAFQPGSLNILTVPSGADSTGTNASGGAAGTGVLDVDNLNLGGLGATLLIEFEVTLAPVIANGSYVANQSELLYAGNVVAASDDPTVNGAADPTVAGDEDPTRVLIESAAYLTVEKISTYLTGDPTVLLAGEMLRYTITVQNIGTDNASGVEIVDQVPANTTYVAGSTTLNGIAVADSGTGGSPLTDGILINAPQDPTPGVMNTAVANNTATIIFDVLVSPDVGDGTVLSNQAFVSAPASGIADQPSDDPRTPIANDPTRDIVGRLPLLFAEKSAQLELDGSSPGIIDPGDTLRYTITIYNNGSVPATVVELFDDVPTNTTYVADTLTLNGLPVGQPDGGVFPLAARIAVSSADLTPPLPVDGEGVLSPGASAVIEFELRVDDAVPSGTLISNQAVVYTDELSNLLTDGDGNPATGPEPTVVVVGDTQQLSIIKEVAVLDGGAALAGATLEYTVTVRNIGAVPALYVVITDDLSVPMPGYLSYVDQSATVNGLPGGVTVTGTILSADYFAESGPLYPDESVVLRFRAIIDPTLVVGTTVTNTAQVSWDDPLRWAEASVSIDVGAMPQLGLLSGNVWHDADHDNTPDSIEQPLEVWTVELLRDDQAVRSVLTDADGNYVLAGVPPNYLTGETYSLRFSAPGAGLRTALLGLTDSDFTDELQRIDDIVVTDGSNLLALNMPVDPNGVIYDSVTRAPISGATVTLVDARNGAPAPSACFDDPTQQDQVTVANGYYKFDMNFLDPGCPSPAPYVIRAVAPDSRYLPGVSEMIPPSSDLSTAPFDVPACPGSTNDAVPATSQYCEAQLSEFAPATSVPARSAGTDYHLLLQLDNTRLPGSAQLFNNHIPLDPRLDGAVAVTKTTPLVNVSRGQLIPYVITVRNSFGADLTDVNIVDRFPAGFRYIAGSARFDGVATEPAIAGRELTWSNLSLATDGRHTIKLLLAAGAGISEGEFTNRAQAINAITAGLMSEEAAATVRLVPDPTFDCTDVSGKVFDDINRNGYQDVEESGLPGVRLVTATGLAATTDQSGRYHITCAIVPHDARGSNFVLKLDDRTLPSGFRRSTRPLQVQRATRGKALRMNFGASIYRVVGLDISDAVFEPGTTQIRQQWLSRFDLLLGELQKGPAVLRLSYVADIEAADLVEERLSNVKRDIADAWSALKCCYELVIEPEVFWRLGDPPENSEVGKQ